MASGDGRLLIVSNRLPVKVTDAGGEFRLEPSSGGLATGVQAAHRPERGLWFGSPGEGLRLNKSRLDTLSRLLRREGFVPLDLSTREVRQYYDGYSNGVLWPLFHYLLDRLPLAARDWPMYCRVNERFADLVAGHYRPGDRIWIHDYHLMLLPGLLRERLPDAPIGFFLHIPFPSSELFRILPQRRALLDGILGADLVGFHTQAYLRHFVVTLRHVAALDPVGDALAHRGRLVRFGCFPMGVDSARFQAIAEDGDVVAEAIRIRAEAGDRRILLGVDRLDYTKGIPRRLVGFERFLEKNPAAVDHVRLIQLAVPSRVGDESYQAFRRQVEEIIGRINGRFGSLGNVPIHYMHRAVSRETLVAMFRAADVLLVTPVRDGMNLVAKEFVASRVDGDGVLILSEFAGAAAELGEAILVNPFDVDGVADAINRALALDPPDVRSRMISMRERVMRDDVHRWIERFLQAVDETVSLRGTAASPRTPIDQLERRITGMEAQGRVALLLDYDGTLVPFAAAPMLARPDAELLELLRRVAKRPALDVHLVSGRPRAQLEEWFGRLPVHLWAEHGLWSRPAGSVEWTLCVDPPRGWMDQAESVLQRACASTPGSFIERKTASLAWHYRMADAEFGSQQARQLESLLRSQFAEASLDVIRGNKVIEIRPSAVHKGLAVGRVIAGAEPPPLAVAVGDDETDEDMFAAVPASGLAVRVGPGASRASMRLEDWQAVRALLDRLTAGAGEAGEAPAAPRRAS